MAGEVTLDSLALPLSGERFGLERATEGLRVVRLADSQSVGTLAVDTFEDGLVIRSLCIAEEHRSYGAGSEAALLFNRGCDAAKIPLVRTWAPPDRGLAVYFWIRMGYRPIGGQGPDGGLQFERVWDGHA